MTRTLLTPQFVRDRALTVMDSSSVPASRAVCASCILTAKAASSSDVLSKLVFQYSPAKTRYCRLNETDPSLNIYRVASGETSLCCILSMEHQGSVRVERMAWLAAGELRDTVQASPQETLAIITEGKVDEQWGGFKVLAHFNRL